MSQAIAAFQMPPKTAVSVSALTASRTLSREFAIATPEADRLVFARAFGYRVVTAWWEALTAIQKVTDRLREPLQGFELIDLSSSAAALADNIGQAAARLDAETAAYQIGLAYTGMLPATHRSTHGIYYTPPPLTARLIAQATKAGTDWNNVRVLDPACGGGAFLTPVAQKMVGALAGQSPRDVLQSIAARVRGYELDPFGAWLSQISLDAALLPISRAADDRLPIVVTVCDSLRRHPLDEPFDLVIGNPPYGRITLSTAERARFKRSVFGHANLYGLFTDIALQHVRPGGVVAYLTPTSFLAGEYFKNLRALLARDAPPVTIDFVTLRKGVFDDVLQETLLATYRRGDTNPRLSIHQIEPGGLTATIAPAGAISLPAEPSRPWLLPRNKQQARLICRLAGMRHRLADWGYRVSTGPLVWNRFKTQLVSRSGPNRYPLIWAEAVTSDGRFIHRADKRSHSLFFLITRDDDWLLVDQPCVLVQRTTAKEQARRLIAAALPADFLVKHRAVVVENHLNMLRRTMTSPPVTVDVLAAFLNSAAADRVFRCVSGSVAVSAYELEALPLPSPEQLSELRRLVRQKAETRNIEGACARLYDQVG